MPGIGLRVVLPESHNQPIYQPWFRHSIRIPTIQARFIQRECLDNLRRDMQIEELQKAWQVWRQCRLRYPGWVIAPDTSRESLWAHTEHWIEPAFHSAADLQPI